MPRPTSNHYYWLLTLILLGNASLNAQQLPTFAMYRDAWNVLNPASISNDYLFSDYSMSVMGSYRNQWTGFEGAPQTALLNWEYVLDAQNAFTGIYLINDEAGSFGHTGLYGRFGYRINLDYQGDRFLNVALNGGYVQYRNSTKDVEFATINASPNNALFYYIDVGLGLMYYQRNDFYVGISVPQLFGVDTQVDDNGDLQIKRIPHYYLLAGAYFDTYMFGSDASFVEFSGFLRYVENAPPSLDLKVQVRMGEIFWVGAGTGGLHTLRAEAGLIINEAVNFFGGQFKIGVAYAFGNTSVIRNFGNTTEVNVAYSWGELR